MKKLLNFILAVLMFVLFYNVSISAKVKGNFGELSNDELNILTDSVNKNLLTRDFNYELISSMNHPNRYILVELNEKGYLIFDRFFQEYSEFSLNSISPYSNYSGKKIYYGPTQYFLCINNFYYDVFNKEKIEEIDVESLQKMEIMNKKIFQEEKEAIYFEDFNNNEKILVNNSNPINTLYFRNLITNIGENRRETFSGSCAIVTYGMILSYYDCIYNDNFIEERFDVNALHNFTDISSVDVEAYDDSPGIFGGNGGFHNYLIDSADDLNLIDISKGEYSTNINGIITLSNWYSNKINIDITGHNRPWYSLISKYNYAKNAINDGYPVYISITGVDDSSLIDKNSRHAVVGYDYTSDGIIVNFGWGYPGYTDINIRNYTINNVGYFEVNKAHNHSYNYIYTINGHKGLTCLCNEVKKCSSLLYQSLDDNCHRKYCDICDISIFEPHKLVLECTPLKHTYKCAYCTYSISENHKWVHNQFQTYCSICGFISDVQPYVYNLGDNL